MLGLPQDVKLATCAADKARRLLDYKTTVTLRDGLQKTIDFIHKKNPRQFGYRLDLEILNELTPKTWKDRLF